MEMKELPLRSPCQEAKKEKQIYINARNDNINVNNSSF
jgi:hypothetical protein